MTETWRRAVYPSLLVLFGLAYAWRMSGWFALEPVTTHLSNFYLTGAALTLVSGPRAFVDPMRRPRALAAAAGLAALNLIAEVALAAGDVDERVNRAMGDVNTTDAVDGMFGLAAVAFVLLLLPPRPQEERAS